MVYYTKIGTYSLFWILNNFIVMKEIKQAFSRYYNQRHYKTR